LYQVVFSFNEINTFIKVVNYKFQIQGIHKISLLLQN